MRLKTVEIEGKTYAEVDGDKPIYVDDAGKTIPFDAPGTVATITRLNGEARSHRERAEAAEKSLKGFEGITDPAAARKALQTVQSLDQKQLVDAGKVEEIRAAAVKAVEEQYAPFKQRAETLEQQLHKAVIGGSFAGSKFIADKLAVPVPMIEATFGKHFALEDGKMVAKDQNGNAIYSKARPGELANFDEALESLVEAFPYRDSIMKGLQQTGGGAKPGAGGGQGAKTITRAAFMKMDPAAQQAAVVRDGYTVTD